MLRATQQSDNKILSAIGGGKQRASNIEFLRIISMLLVLLIHYVGTIKVDPVSIRTSTIDSLITIEMHSLAVVCVNCFILISGYFGIRWKAKSLASLLYQVLFWLFVGVMVANILDIKNTGSLVSIIGNYFSGRWFVPAYLGLYFLSPALNALIEKSNQKKLGRYIILFYLYSTIIGYALRSQEFNEGMSVMSLVGLYLIGAFLRKTSYTIFCYRPLVDFGIYLTLSLLLTGVNSGLLFVGISKSPLGYLNPLVILMSIYLFLFFQKLRIGEIKIINFVAASAFAVYLFHMHPLLYGLYQQICDKIHSAGIEAVFLLPIFFTTIFILTIIIDRIRIVSFGIIWNKILRNENPVGAQ